MSSLSGLDVTLLMLVVLAFASAATLGIRLGRKEAQATNLTATIATRDQTVAEHASTIETLETTIGQLRSDLGSHLVTIAGSGERERSLTATIDRLTNEATRIQAVHATEIGDFEATIDGLRETLAQSRATIAGANERERNLVASIERLTWERDRAVASREEVNTQLATSRDEVARLRALLDAKEQLLADDEHRVAALRSQMAEVFEEKARIVIDTPAKHSPRLSKKSKRQSMACLNRSMIA